MYTSNNAYYVITKSVKYHLTSAIKGKIKVEVNCDTMYIKIISNYKIEYVYVEYSINDKIIKGVTGKIIANNAIYQYSKFIKSKFFIN